MCQPNQKRTSDELMLSLPSWSKLDKLRQMLTIPIELNKIKKKSVFLIAVLWTNNNIFLIKIKISSKHKTWNQILNTN